MDMRKQGRDSFEAKDAQAPQRFVVWRPYAMVMTHGLRLSKQSLSKVWDLGKDWKWFRK